MNKALMFCITLVIVNQKANCQDIQITYNNSKKDMIIEDEHMALKSNLVPPIILPDNSVGVWNYLKTTSSEIKLAGMSGRNTIDFFLKNDIVLEREVWLSSDKKVIAIRQALSNNSKDSIRINRMIPLACTSNESFVLKQNPESAKWNILVQKRFKNEFPEAVFHEKNSNSFKDSSDSKTLKLDSTNMLSGNSKMVNDDLPGNDASKTSTTIKADPFFLVPVGPDPNGPSLLIGYLNQTEHLAHFELIFEEENSKTSFCSLKGNCEFNNVIIPPGGKKTCQWIYVTVGQSFEKTIENYTDRVGQYYNLASPQKNAPSVFCSWYYHAWSYSEELFLKDVETFKKDRIPFDVFLIDESWDVSNWGDMMPNKMWPGGMKKAAGIIKEAGYKPGIWMCPYLVDSGSTVAKAHPEWLLKTSTGNNYIFQMNGVDHWVFDLTYPGVLEYLETTFRKISKEWGFQYFKFDFMRAVVMDKDFVFHNPLINRLEAYRQGLEAIRRGVGEDAYLSVCGGHYGGSLGIANSQRSGSDVFSYWANSELPKYKQNVLRTWMTRFWHVDPDAMMVRRSTQKLHPGMYQDLTLGLFNDQEAQVNALNQYMGGGLVSFSEDFAILDEDRKALYKHVIPSVNSSSVPLDWNNPILPSFMLTKIDPICKNLGKWNTLSIINWTERNKNTSFALDDAVLQDLVGEKFLVFEFFSQQFKGLYSRQEIVDFGILSPRKALLVKIIPWNGKTPVLAGTDLHFSMGGVEIGDWNSTKNLVKGTLITKWHYPVKLTIAYPNKENGIKIKIIDIDSKKSVFYSTF